MLLYIEHNIWKKQSVLLPPFLSTYQTRATSTVLESITHLLEVNVGRVLITTVILVVSTVLQLILITLLIISRY